MNRLLKNISGQNIVTAAFLVAVLAFAALASAWVLYHSYHYLSVHNTTFTFAYRSGFIEMEDGGDGLMFIILLLISVVSIYQTIRYGFKELSWLVFGWTVVQVAALPGLFWLLLMFINSAFYAMEHTNPGG